MVETRGQIEGVLVSADCQRKPCGPPMTPLPCGDDVSQLRCVGCDFDRDGFKVQVLLLGMDGVRPGGYVLQAERAISFCSDCGTKTC